jgi:hypothetical protein
MQNLQLSWIVPWLGMMAPMCLSEATRCAVRAASDMIDRLYVHELGLLLNCDAAVQYFCENVHDGGSWLLVRRVKQGDVWHEATDGLKGTYGPYGTYGSPTSDGSFGIPYLPWVNEDTEFLFMTG